jgi:hypothetical protein
MLKRREVISRRAAAHSCLKENQLVNCITRTFTLLVQQYVIPKQCQAEPWGSVRDFINFITAVNPEVIYY